MIGQPIHVYGGVYVVPGATGGVLLFDVITGLTTAQNLVDQAITDTATLYITLQSKSKVFWLRSVTMGYVNDDSINDLAELFLLEGLEADDGLQRQKCRWSDEDGINEGVWAPVTVDHVPFVLDTAGRLYFLINFTTAVPVNDHADDRFFLRVDGYTFHRSP